MTSKNRKPHSPRLEAQFPLPAMRGQKTVWKLAAI
jgi:hypothetical protein